MAEQHPMLPTNEQLAKWESDWFSERQNADILLIDAYAAGAAAGADAGADAELEACVKWLEQQSLCGHRDLIPQLRAARRPKPPSLKQQAFKALDCIEADFNTVGDRADTIRRALEALPDD